MNSNSNDDFSSLLSDEDQKWIVNFLVSRARSLAPSHIAPFIIADNSEVKKVGGEWVISLVARVGKYKGMIGVPDARAQEYGSGEHSTRNFKSPNQVSVGGKIRIRAKNVPFLVFHWEGYRNKQIIRRKTFRDLRVETEFTRRVISITKYENEKFTGSAPKNPVLRKAWMAAHKKISGGDRFDSNWLRSQIKREIDAQDREDGMGVKSEDESLYIGKSVLHPGIHPYRGVGYMRVALEKSKETILEEVKSRALENLHIRIAAVFSRPGGKNK